MKKLNLNYLSYPKWIRTIEYITEYGFYSGQVIINNKNYVMIIFDYNYGSRDNILIEMEEIVINRFMFGKMSSCEFIASGKKYYKTRENYAGVWMEIIELTYEELYENHQKILPKYYFFDGLDMFENYDITE